MEMSDNSQDTAHAPGDQSREPQLYLLKETIDSAFRSDSIMQSICAHLDFASTVRFALTSSSVINAVTQRYLTKIWVNPNVTPFLYFHQSLDWLLRKMNHHHHQQEQDTFVIDSSSNVEIDIKSNDMMSVPHFESLYIEDTPEHGGVADSSWTWEPSEEVFHHFLTSTCLPLRNLSRLHLRSLKSCESSVLGFIKLCPRLSSLLWFAEDNSCFCAYLKEQPMLQEVGFTLNSTSDEILYCLGSLKHRPKRIEVHSARLVTYSAKFPSGWASNALVVDFRSSGVLSSVIRGAWTEAAEVFADFFDISPHRVRFGGKCAVAAFMNILPIKATIGLIQEIYRSFVPDDVSFPERLAILRDIIYCCRSRGWSGNTVMKVTEWVAIEASAHCNGDNLQRLLLLATVFDFGGSSGFQFQGLSLMDALCHECPTKTLEHLEWAVALVNRFASASPAIYRILAENQDTYKALDCTIFDLALLDPDVASRVRSRMSEAEFYETIERSQKRVEYLKIFHPGDPLWKLALAYFDPAQSNFATVSSLADAILLPDRTLALLTNSLAFGQAMSVLGVDTVTSHPTTVAQLLSNVDTFLPLFTASRKLFMTQATARAVCKNLTLRSHQEFLAIFPIAVAAVGGRRNDPIWRPLFDKYLHAETPSSYEVIDSWIPTSTAFRTPMSFTFWLNVFLQCFTENTVPAWYIMRFVETVLGPDTPQQRLIASPDFKIFKEDVLNPFIWYQPEAASTLLFRWFPDYLKPSQFAEHVLGYVNASLSAKNDEYPLKCLSFVMFHLVDLIPTVKQDAYTFLDLLVRLVDTNNIHLIQAALDSDPNFAQFDLYPNRSHNDEKRPGWVLDSAIRKGDPAVLDLLLRRTSFTKPLTHLLNLFGSHSLLQSIFLSGSVDSIRHVLFAFAHSSALLYDIFCPNATTSPSEIPNAKIIQTRSKDLAAIFSLPTHDWLWEAVPGAWCAFIGFPLHKISQRAQYDVIVSYYNNIEASVAKLLIRISSTLLSPFAAWLSQQPAHASERRKRCVGLFRDLIITHLNLLAARQNWDGLLSTTISLQKSLASTKIPVSPDLFSAACMCANLKLGNEQKARKHAQQLEFGPLQYFVYLDAEAAWKRLVATSESLQTDAVRKVNFSSPAASSSSSSSSSTAPVPNAATAASSQSSSAAKGKAKKNASGKKSVSEPASSSSTPVMSPKQASNSSSSFASPASKKTGNAPKASPPKQQASPSLKSSSSSSTSSAATAAATPPSSPPPQQQQQKPPRKSPDAALLYLSCPICFDCLPDHGIIPCGHMFCGDCLEGLESCAICRVRIASTIKMFFSQGDNSDDNKKE